MLADERELGCPGVAKVDDDDGVARQVHLRLDLRPGMGQLGAAQVADEDGVLEPLAVLLLVLHTRRSRRGSLMS